MAVTMPSIAVPRASSRVGVGGLGGPGGDGPPILSWGGLGGQEGPNYT